MAWQQLRYILDGEVQSSDDATKVIDLPRSNVLHTLYVKVECTNGSTSNQGADISDVVDKIEVIANGSEVLYSMTPKEIERWALLETGKPIMQERNEAGSAVQMAIYPIYFGRDEFDPEFWLPCDRFTDLELRIKYSPDIGATDFATGTTTITVLALMTMGGDPGPYAGTLKTSTIYSFTSAASGDETIDLPQSHPYRRLLVYAHEAGVADGSNITNVKFSLNNDEQIPFNLKWDDLQQWNQLLFNIDFEERWHLFRSDTDTVTTYVGRIVGYSLEVNEDVDLTNDTFILDRIDTITGDQLTINSSEVDVTAGSEDITAYTTDHDMFLTVKGLGLPYATVLPFDLFGDEESFDPGAYDQVQLILTNGNAGATVKVSLQEILTY